MNWLLIIVILIIAWNIAIGYNRGFLRIIYSLLAWVLVVGISTAATPYVKEVLQQNTDIEAKIEQNVKCEYREKHPKKKNTRSRGAIADELCNQPGDPCGDNPFICNSACS